MDVPYLICLSNAMSSMHIRTNKRYQKHCILTNLRLLELKKKRQER